MQASPSASGLAVIPDSGSAVAVTGSDAGAGEPTPPVGMQSIPERFANEAKSRPTGTVRVEDVFAAFQGEGAKIREQRQHLAGPFLASYCVGAQTGEDVHLSVCEYKDAAKAKEGKAMSDQAFGTVPNRTLYQNGGTTLTVRVGGSSAADKELAKKLVQTFSTLTVKK